MKYIAITAAVLAMPSTVHAAEWWWTGSSTTKPSRAAYFVDRESVQKIGGYTRAWVKMIPEDQAVTSEILALHEVDCSQRRLRLLSFIARRPDGRTDNTTFQSGWSFSAPESAIDGTVSALCGDEDSWIAQVRNPSEAAKVVFEYLE